MKLVLLEAVLMDNGELISAGRSLGFLSDFVDGVRSGMSPVYEVPADVTLTRVTN